MGAKKQTIGYRYYFSLHMGLGRGPVNELAEIRAGDLTASDGPVDVAKSGKLISINKPDLFGGEKKEGGIQGPLYIYNGAADQQLQPAMHTLPAIARSLGGDVPSFRGVVTLWFDGLVACMNPYPKEWSFRVRRWDAGWFNDTPWYPQTALIPLVSENGGEIKAMNGAHILYEVNTNPEWGRGMPRELIDEDSYAAAADTLYEEGFGLCIPWFRQENIKEFIPIVIDHIGGVQYVDRRTGKMTLKLIRGGYNPDYIPLFTPDNGLLDVLDDDASGEETAYNEIIVTGFDPSSKEDIQVRVHNLASIQSLGEIISNTVEYRGLATRALTARVAQRELKAQLPLRRMNVLLDRRGWRIAPGSVFRISHPAKGINNLILRAGECTDGTLTNGQISIKAVEDIFGMPETSFVSPGGSEWTAPDFTAKPPSESRLTELNWRNFYRTSDPADRDAIDAGSSYVMMLAKDPDGVLTAGYDIATHAGGPDTEYVVGLTGGFTNWLTLLNAIEPLDTTLTVRDVHRDDFMIEFVPGMMVLIGDEEMGMSSFDPETGVAEVIRGASDTLPATHLPGATVWLVDDEMVSDRIEYQAGETVYGKALTRTSSDLLLLDLADELTVTVNQRVFRPYPPGNVKLNGRSIYTLPQITVDEPVLTWAHRDRIVEADAIVGHVEGSVGPEPGTTYTIRVYAEDGVTLLREVDAGLVDTWTYDSTMQAADSVPDLVWVELESKRDGLASFFHYRFKVVLTAGYGYGWGDNWGG